MNKKKEEHLQFHYFPYLYMDSEIKLGPFVIWPWNKGKCISDKKTKSAIEERFSIYRNKYGRKLTPPTLVSYRKKDNFRPLNSKVEYDLELVKHIFFFLGIAKSNIPPLFSARNNNWCGHYCCTSENFQLFHQNFRPSSEFTAISSGFIVNIKDSSDIKSIKLTPPEHVNLSYKYDFNNEVLQAFHESFSLKDNQAIRRIYAALRWFYHAYHNTENISIDSRIMMMGIAFETLFDIQDKSRKKAPFAREIEKLAHAQGDRAKSFVEHANDPSGKKMRGSKKKEWACRFYELRNSIAHGDSIKRDQFSFKGLNHFNVAVMFFVQCVKQMLSACPGNSYVNYNEIRCKTKPCFVFDDGSTRGAFIAAMASLRNG